MRKVFRVETNRLKISKEVPDVYLWVTLFASSIKYFLGTNRH